MACSMVVKVLKEREFSFDAEYQSGDMNETVRDFSANPPKQYNRSQKINKHFMQLNVKPEMANGKWTESAIQ